MYRSFKEAWMSSSRRNICEQSFRSENTNVRILEWGESSDGRSWSIDE